MTSSGSHLAHASRHRIRRIAVSLALQIIAIRFVYPGEAVITAVLLAIVPYMTLRGLVTRFTRK